MQDALDPTIGQTEIVAMKKKFTEWSSDTNSSEKSKRK